MKKALLIPLFCFFSTISFTQVEEVQKRKKMNTPNDPTRKSKTNVDTKNYFIKQERPSKFKNYSIVRL